MQARIDEGSDLMSQTASSDGVGAGARASTREEEEEEEWGEEGDDENYPVDKILAVRKVCSGGGGILKYSISPCLP